MSGLALVLMLVRSLLAWSRLWSEQKMHAAELSDEVESEVQATAVCERVQMRESSSNINWDIPGTSLHLYRGFTSYTYIGIKYFLSTTTHVTLMMKH